MYAKLVKLNDHWTKDALERQVLDNSSRYFGGLIDPASGIARPKHMGTAGELSIWASAIVNRDSSYYHDSDLLLAMDRCADFLLNRQHVDGTISLGSTNFNSPSVLNNDQHPDGCQYVHINLVTPFDRTFVVRLK